MWYIFGSSEVDREVIVRIYFVFWKRPWMRRGLGAWRRALEGVRCCQKHRVAERWEDYLLWDLVFFHYFVHRL